jgi:hypothetical protein
MYDIKFISGITYTSLYFYTVYRVFKKDLADYKYWISVDQ